MTSRIVFSEAAREDRRDITGYTVERFGIGQARRLRDRFQQVLTTLADNPQMGLSRTELDPPGYSFRYFVVMKTFLLVYRPISDGIEVARILHTSRGLVSELERDAGTSAQELNDET